MEDDKRRPAVHPSRGADAAAVRWGEAHPDEDVEHPAPPGVPEAKDVVPGRHSASAEAAALRWREQEKDRERQNDDEDR